MATFFTPVRLRAIAWLVGIFVVLFAALQFVRPTLTNPPVVADLQAPDDVKAILKTSCYNCHSNETQVPWFDKIVPAYWLVVRDVRHGRAHLNFSNFGKMTDANQKAMLYESVNLVMLSAMPPGNYKFIHPESIVTPAQLDVLKNYLHPATEPVPSPEEAAKHEQARQTAGQEAEEQYLTWITNSATTAAQKVAPAANGLNFFPDYKDWRPISTTDRFDNDTFRVILGNDVAQRAIADNQIHPWPDGTTFAKVAWKQHEADDATLHSGSFVQVEFMTKDAKKYASTEGWGFGRWRGVDHKPYGKTASFTVECTSCHAPMQDNDYVYTMPIHDLSTSPPNLCNRDAMLTGLPAQPLNWRVITSSANKKDHTMSTLYGNDAAVDHARSGSQDPYPAGSVLAFVTWDQKDDMHWFGARIPGKPRSVEYVTVIAGADGKPVPAYQIYSGSPLEKSTNPDAATNQPRIDAITGMEAAVMP